MKRLKTIAFAGLLTLFAVSCEDQHSNETPTLQPSGVGDNDSNPPATLPVDVSAYAAIAGEVLDYTYQQSSSYMATTFNYFSYNREAALRDELVQLNSLYGIQTINLNTLANSIANAPLPAQTTAPLNVGSVTGFNTYFNATQITLLNTYFNSMLPVQNLAAINAAYNQCVTSVNNNASLTTVQKFALLALIQPAHEYAKDFFAGALYGVIADVQDQIQSQANAAARAAGGCGINFKSMWRDAVIGLATGAVTGGYIGATGGTVVLPGVGSVTGGVGGAVFGGTAGFIGGAAQNLVGQFLFGCMSSYLPLTKLPSCEGWDEWEMAAAPCDPEPDDNKLWFQLVGNPPYLPENDIDFVNP